MPIPSENNAVLRVTAKERVYKTLQQWIINGTLEPEERLNDAELAKHFQVSRTPVREALQMLAEQKLVYMVPSSGTYVSAIDIEDMEKVYELLGGLQAFALELGIKNAAEEQLRELTYINETFKHCSEKNDPVTVMDADCKFHHLLAELSGNHYIVTYTDDLMLQAHRNEIQFFKQYNHLTESYEAHVKIIDALREKNLQKAIRLVKDNWQISLPQREMLEKEEHHED